MSLVFLLLYFLLHRPLHLQQHLLDVLLEPIVPLIVVTLIIDLPNTIPSTFLKLLIVPVFVSCRVNWTLQTPSQSETLHHSLGEVGSVCLFELGGHVCLHFFHVVPVVLLDHVLGSQVHLFFVAGEDAGASRAVRWARVVFVVVCVGALCERVLSFFDRVTFIF